MNMKMTLKEKIKATISIIDEARTIQNTNPVYVPVDFFSANNLGFPNVRDVFRMLQENKAIKTIKKGWFCEEIRKGDTRKIVRTGDEQTSEDDYEAYEIEINTEQWAATKKLSTKNAAKVVAIPNDLIFTESGLLYSKSKPEIKLSFGKNTARYKIVDALVDANGASVSTTNLRTLSGKETNRNVQKEIGAIRKRIATKMFGIKKPGENEVVEGEEYSGYRFVIKVKKLK